MIEFENRMEQNGHIYEPVRDNLPEYCYSILRGSNNIIIIKRNESGYYKTDITAASKEDARALVDEYNCRLGVTKAQEEAMKTGSMFGWSVPGADPKNYDSDGKPIKLKVSRLKWYETKKRDRSTEWWTQRDGKGVYFSIKEIGSEKKLRLFINGDMDVMKDFETLGDAQDEAEKLWTPVKASGGGALTGKIKTAYAPWDDMTFILDEGVGYTEVVGFYWGQPNDAATKMFLGKLRAEY